MVTIKDVAQAAGVSAMTVSRYFNEPEKLKEKTYNKIQDIVEEMGYQPNMVARLLVTKKTNIVCVYIAKDIDVLQPLIMQVISGIAEKLGESGYSMLLCRENYEKVTCDGIIAMGLNHKQEKQLMRLSKEKAIIIFGNSSYENNWIDIDNYIGSYKATEYMIERGYKKIANIGIDNEITYYDSRFQGYKDCMKEHGVEILNGIVLKTSNHIDDGYSAIEQIYSQNKIDAVVCASDTLALGVIKFANEKNVKVPDELGIIGFGGWGYEETVVPKLTTMQQPAYRAGKVVSERIIDIIQNGESKKTEIFIEPILLVNGTTK